MPWSKVLSAPRRASLIFTPPTVAPEEEADATLATERSQSFLTFSAISPPDPKPMAEPPPCGKPALLSGMELATPEEYNLSTSWAPFVAESSRVKRAPIIDSATQTIDLLDKIRISDPGMAFAHGGFSDVYRGEWMDVTDNLDSAGGHTNVIAVKLLLVFMQRVGNPERSRKRLNQEVNVWKRLEHPNIAKFFGISFDLGRPALVMQWYEKGTAPIYIKDSSPASKLLFVEGVCSGLRYLHELQPPVIHGDLKGSNILVDDGGHPRLSDFGLAKILDEHEGLTGNTTMTLAGSVRWQAPELHFEEEEENLSNPPVGAALPADVWSLGCTIYELLIGKIPYHHWSHNWKVIKDVMNGISPLRPEDDLIHQSKEFSNLLRDCWMLDPEKRPTMSVVCSRLSVVALHYDPLEPGSMDSVKLTPN